MFSFLLGNFLLLISKAEIVDATKAEKHYFRQISFLRFREESQAWFESILQGQWRPADKQLPRTWRHPDHPWRLWRYERFHPPSFFLWEFDIFTENLLRSINDLIALVKKLQQDIANQHADIRRLQSLIENCAGCKEAAPIRARPDVCATANICFPGKPIRLSHLP